MATVNCTAIKNQPALRGASVIIELSGAESLSILPLLGIGQSCVIESSNKTGYIDFIDAEGHSFRIKPPEPVDSCDSDTPGVLKDNELITITL